MFHWVLNTPMDLVLQEKLIFFGLKMIGYLFFDNELQSIEQYQKQIVCNIQRILYPV